MIVLIEGIDRVGKTTLANKLESQGFIYLKDEFLLDGEFIKEFADYSVGKCDTLLALALKLNANGKNIVIDRLHLTEIVYGTTVRNGDINEVACFGLDCILANAGAILVYVAPTDIEYSNKLANTDQTKRNELFNTYTKLSSMELLVTDYNHLDYAFSLIMQRALKYDFYFASPFFNDEQVEREERMIRHLRHLGFKVFSPKENCLLGPKASTSERDDVFSSNCEAINCSRAVFAVTDGKDMGTIWEAGYAYGIKKPVIYYAETLGDNSFNLMLAQSARDVFTSQDEVTLNSLLDILNGTTRKYKGDIE